MVVIAQMKLSFSDSVEVVLKGTGGGRFKKSKPHEGCMSEQEYSTVNKGNFNC